MFKRREPACYAVAHVHRIQRCLQTWAEGAHSRRVQIARTARFKLDHAPFRFLGLDRVPSLGKDLGVASRFPGGIKSFLVLVVGCIWAGELGGSRDIANYNEPAALAFVMTASIEFLL